MAQRRMFSLKIIDTDLFLDMPMSARLLYYDLSMRADDDGFVASPKKIQRMIGCSDDDFKILISKQFIIPFENGICVIKHWRIHNYIQKDRYTKTLYQDEKQQLIETDGSYEFKGIEDLDTKCIQNVSNSDTQVRLGKVRLEIGKDSIDIEEEPQKPKVKDKKETKHKYGEFNHVTLTDKEYEKLIKDFNENTIQSFITKIDEYVELHGKNYKNYNLAIRQWIKREKTFSNSGKKTDYKKTNFNSYEQRDNDYSEMERKALAVSSKVAEEAKGNIENADDEFTKLQAKILSGK